MEMPVVKVRTRWTASRLALDQRATDRQEGGSAELKGNRRNGLKSILRWNKCSLRDSYGIPPGCCSSTKDKKRCKKRVEKEKAKELYKIICIQCEPIFRFCQHVLWAYAKARCECRSLKCYNKYTKYERSDSLIFNIALAYHVYIKLLLIYNHRSKR